MRLRKRENPLEGVNLLELAPVRRAGWTETEGRVVIQRSKPEGRGVRGLLRRVAWAMAPRRIRLDPLGSSAWRRLDGDTTVGQVAEALREQFGEEAEPVEERLGHFVRMLHRERLVSYPGYPE